MSLRPILIHPDPRLKKVCDPVPAVDAAIARLADDMLETMYDAPGVGLAAPQVGVNARILVMDCAGKDEAPAPRVLINPEITWTSEDTATREEGCLSIPEMYEDVTRPAKVRVRYIDAKGAVQEEDYGDLWAVCAQHEIDHLNGRLFIDYLSPLKRRMITDKMIKLKREKARAG